MLRRQLFRANAEDCFRLAEIMKSPEVRGELIAMAHTWHRLAQEFDIRGEPSLGSWYPKEDSRRRAELLEMRVSQKS